MAEPRIQLWTDETEVEFAILLKNSHYVIKTNEKTEFTKMIDESAFMHGYSYDWKYTLSQWVNYHFGNQVLVNLSESSPVLNPKFPKEKATRKAKGIKQLLTYIKPPRPNNESILKSKTQVLKCRFCNLKYFISEEREQHEKFWHSDKNVGQVKILG